MTSDAEILVLAILSYLPVGIVLGGALIVYRKLTRNPVSQIRLALYFALGFTIFVPLLLTILPVPSDMAGYCRRSAGHHLVRLDAFDFIRIVWRYLENEGNARAYLHGPFWQAFLNFIMLMPLGVMLNLVWRFGFVRGTVFAFLLSLLFEATQYTAGWGLFLCPYRTFDVDDLILNAGGAGLACGGVWLVRLVLSGLIQKPEGSEAP